MNTTPHQPGYGYMRNQPAMRNRLTSAVTAVTPVTDLGRTTP